ncbi:MAG UNVERIFIED_CONTAM: ThuA domain-containing protein [Planctomycetaceae bacterium]
MVLLLLLCFTAVVDRGPLVSTAVAFQASSTAVKQPAAGATEARQNRPLRALLITGGCCHDYERQKRILTRGLSARANIQWTIVHQGGSTTDTKIPFYNDPNWADGFDVVVHNECFAGVVDREFVDGILKAHQKGVPAVLIHCAMHCYRVGDDRWFEFCGVQSPGHGPHYAYTIENLKPEHPIMEGFGERFMVPKGELYHTVRIFDTATPLAHARRMDNDEPQVCVWTNDYRGTRVFATTVGHYNETMVEPVWLDMVSRGLLWATGRDPNQHFARLRRSRTKPSVRLSMPRLKVPHPCWLRAAAVTEIWCSTSQPGLPVKKRARRTSPQGRRWPARYSLVRRRPQQRRITRAGYGNSTVSP